MIESLQLAFHTSPLALINLLASYGKSSAQNARQIIIDKRKIEIEGSE